MKRALPVCVVGGGPAGALCAAGLAAAGHSVTLVDEHLAWEKPCGGGITDKALQHFPFLREAAALHNPVHECELTSPAGRRLLLRLDRTVAIFSRHTLNGLLLERARRAGAVVVQERAVELRAASDGWRVRLRGGAQVLARRVVIAAGARNAFGPRSTPLPSPMGAGEWMATAGYYLGLEHLPWPRQRMAIRFLPGLEGYVWSFPRGDHASIGICGRLGDWPTARLRQTLEKVLEEWGVDWRGGKFYAHLLPAPSPQGLRQAQWAGREPHPWALVGDAAGLVDPITGEGLYYALRSAELLAAAVAAGEPQAEAAYNAALREQLTPELQAAGEIAERFYHGHFLRAPVLERMTQFGQRCPQFRSLLCDLFSGAQGYGDLRPRLYRQLVPSLWRLALPHGARA